LVDHNKELFKLFLPGDDTLFAKEKDDGRQSTTQPAKGKRPNEGGKQHPLQTRKGRRRRTENQNK
jgi:hypothetical protein